MRKVANGSPSPMVSSTTPVIRYFESFGIGLACISDEVMDVTADTVNVALAMIRSEIKKFLTIVGNVIRAWLFNC